MVGVSFGMLSLGLSFVKNSIFTVLYYLCLCIFRNFVKNGIQARAQTMPKRLSLPRPPWHTHDGTPATARVMLVNLSQITSQSAEHINICINHCLVEHVNFFDNKCKLHGTLHPWCTTYTEPATPKCENLTHARSPHPTRFVPLGRNNRSLHAVLILILILMLISILIMIVCWSYECLTRALLLQRP